MTTPETLEEHDRAGGRGDTGGVANALSAGLLVGLSVVGIIVNVVGVLLAATQPADAAANGGLAGVVAPELLGVGEDCLEELQRDDVDALVLDRLDAGHADILNHTEVGQVLLSEGHPEACPAEGGEVLD